MSQKSGVPLNEVVLSKMSPERHLFFNIFFAEALYLIGQNGKQGANMPFAPTPHLQELYETIVKKYQAGQYDLVRGLEEIFSFKRHLTVAEYETMHKVDLGKTIDFKILAEKDSQQAEFWRNFFAEAQALMDKLEEDGKVHPLTPTASLQQKYKIAIKKYHGEIYARVRVLEKIFSFTPI